MSITLELKPEIESRLVAHAAAQGLSVEAYLQSLIENSLAAEETSIYRIATPEDWETALQELGQSLSLVKARPLSDEAISRESIYCEREDSQL